MSLILLCWILVIKSLLSWSLARIWLHFFFHSLPFSVNKLVWENVLMVILHNNALLLPLILPKSSCPLGKVMDCFPQHLLPTLFIAVTANDTFCCPSIFVYSTHNMCRTFQGIPIMKSLMGTPSGGGYTCWKSRITFQSQNSAVWWAIKTNVNFLT